MPEASVSDATQLDQDVDRVNRIALIGVACGLGLILFFGVYSGGWGFTAIALWAIALAIAGAAI